MEIGNYAGVKIIVTPEQYDKHKKKIDSNKDKVINDLLKRISNLEFEVEDLEKYKTRNEKAIEYIEDACWLDEINKPNSLGHKQTIKLLNILQGSDTN